ncbi:MAG: hypothetical protein OEZ43_15430, partial [Gammaproteobacteria bacterium]|nr:hypothetical protein [Gammaproteobacteria bacterium]
YASYYYDADWNRINRNQVTSADKCAAWPSRSCADDKNMFILAKVGKAYGAQMAWVTSSQFKARAAAGQTIFPLDVVEAFGRYVAEGDIEILDLRSGTAATVTVQGLGGAITEANFKPTFPRINLVNELPDGRAEFGFGVIQPMRGATLTPALQADAPANAGSF